MMNENILFEKQMIHSARFNRDIEVEVYEDKGQQVIAANSLFKAFQEIQLSDAPDAIINKDVSIVTADADGEVNYCLCKCTLTDDARDYYDVSFGESTHDTRRTEIAANNPFAVAERRAESKVIIRYFGFPGRVYSSDEVEVAPTKDNVKAVLGGLGKMKDISPKEDENKADDNAGFAEAGVDSGMNEDVSVGDAETHTAETPAVPESAPESRQKPADTKLPAEETEESVEEVAPDEADAAEEEKTEKAEETKGTLEEADNNEESVQAEADAPEPEKNDSPDPMKLIVTYGPAKNKNMTVQEVIKDPACAVFVQKIRSGQAVAPVNDPEKFAIFEAIKNAEM